LIGRIESIHMSLSEISWYRSNMFDIHTLPVPFPVHQHLIMKETQETLEQFIFRICFLLYYVQKEEVDISLWVQKSLMLRNKIFMCCGYSEEIEKELDGYLLGTKLGTTQVAAQGAAQDKKDEKAAIKKTVKKKKSM
jgi:hypothetical protein